MICFFFCHLLESWWLVRGCCNWVRRARPRGRGIPPSRARSRSLSFSILLFGFGEETLALTGWRCTVGRGRLTWWRTGDRTRPCRDPWWRKWFYTGRLPGYVLRCANVRNLIPNSTARTLNFFYISSCNDRNNPGHFPMQCRLIIVFMLHW